LEGIGTGSGAGAGASAPAHAGKGPSLWELLKDESGAEGWEGWVVDGKWERIQQFLAVPLAVERVSVGRDAGELRDAAYLRFKVNPGACRSN
jgi:hypothetical protein